MAISTAHLRSWCVWLCWVLCVGAQADTLHIGSWDRSADPLARVGEAVLLRAYAELQQPVEFVDLPIRRAMVMMLHGDLDGNVYRIAALASEQPGLVRVDPPIAFSEVRAYAQSSGFVANRWSQLSGMRVAYQRGTLVVERNLPQDSVRMEAATIAEMLRMLKRGMVDVALMVEPAHSEPHALAVAVGIARLDGAFDRTALHHYLLAKHREVGAGLSAVIKHMATSGELQRITYKALQAPD